MKMSHSRSPSADPALPPEWTDAAIDACPGEPCAVRIYGRRHPGGNHALVLHFHGGAFVAGSVESGLQVARLLVSTGAIVVSVEYPLAPASPFPAAVDAGYAALLWAHRSRVRLAGPRARLFVAGEEAGANLAAALALVARDRHHPPLAGQILLSPMLDACMATASLRERDAGPVGCRWADGWHSYLQSPSAAEHPYAVPGRASRLGGLAPCLILTATDDPMRDEARAYAARLGEANVAVWERELPSPTEWPCALCEPGPPDAPWREAARSHLERFFAVTAGAQEADGGARTCFPGAGHGRDREGC